MIWAGIGLREGAGSAAFSDALARAGRRPDALACLSIKASPALTAWAKAENLPLTHLTEQDIAGEPTLTCSPRIKARFATGSVAEALALASARKGGYRARLIAPRVASACGMATIALAERTDT
ncbi:cobalamin biosynthesis protein [Nioella aestuarii]